MATYNAGLAVGVLKYVDERVEPLIRALAQEEMDLLCVQEFWLDEHWKKLRSATAVSLPSVFRLLTEEGDGSCNEEEVRPLMACASVSCAGLPVHALPRCLLGSCYGPLTRVSPDCFRCLSANPGQRPADLVHACVAASRRGASAGDERPRRGGPESFLVYSGSYGTGILTSAEILERDAQILPSVLDRRAVLYTKLRTPVGELHAFCTHLTANLSGIPHPGRASWQRDQSAQIDALLAYVEKKADGGPTLILGDLNTGPAITPAIAASLPDHYARIIDRGFQNPYAAKKDVQCTYCFDNPLEGGLGTRGLLIDHVLLRSFEGDTAGRQIMRQSLTVELDKKSVKSGLSDHYGVIVTLSKPPS